MVRILIYGNHRVGKTTLLEAYTLYYLNKDYEIYFIDTTSEEGGKSLLNRETLNKQEINILDVSHEYEMHLDDMVDVKEIKTKMIKFISSMENIEKSYLIGDEVPIEWIKDYVTHLPNVVLTNDTDSCEYCSLFEYTIHLKKKKL